MLEAATNYTEYELWMQLRLLMLDYVFVLQNLWRRLAVALVRTGDSHKNSSRAAKTARLTRLAAAVYAELFAITRLSFAQRNLENKGERFFKGFGFGGNTRDLCNGLLVHCFSFTT